MKIRVATPSEHPAIEALIHDAYAPVLAAMSPEDAQKFRGLLPQAVDKYGKTGLWLVAESGGQLGGCVAYFSPGAVSHPLFHNDWSHIQLLGVAGSGTRRGIGRMLMQRCIAASRDAGARTLGLQTSELMAPARALYESLGFVLEQTLPPAFGHPSYLYVRHEA